MRRTRGRLLKRALIGAGILFACLFVARFVRPPLKEGLGLSHAVHDRDHKLLRLTLSPDQKYRLWLKLADISPSAIEGTLLLEDRNFRLHPGINPISIARAFWQTYVVRGRRVGGSTISMQLARLRHGISSRTFSGKFA